MPFMIGPAPIRRTLQYLKQGKLIFKDRVKVMAVLYNWKGDEHQGARDFVFWNLCQIQYKNPDVQIYPLTNMTPTPFLQIWLDSGKDVIVDMYGKRNDEIMNHLIRILGKTEAQLKAEDKQKQVASNPAKFGSGCDRYCMCEIPGQVTCPCIIKLPKKMTGKYGFKKK